MPSPEGEGNAKSAWDKYYAANKAINKPILAAFPGLTKVLRGYTSAATVDLFGFWLLWQLFGGFEGLHSGLGMSRSTLYRRISQFRAVFGVHPDAWEMPGITVDIEDFASGFKPAFDRAHGRAVDDDNEEEEPPVVS